MYLYWFLASFICLVLLSSFHLEVFYYVQVYMHKNGLKTRLWTTSSNVTLHFANWLHASRVIHGRINFCIPDLRFAPNDKHCNAQCTLTRMRVRRLAARIRYFTYRSLVTRLREISARSDLDDGIKGNREAIENRHWVINAAHNEPPLSSKLVESRRRSWM